MASFPLSLHLLAYTLALWLGLHMLAQSRGEPRLIRAGLGALAYALALAVQVLSIWLPDLPAWRLDRAILFLPAVLWTGTLITLLPEAMAWRQPLDLLWRYGQLPLVAVLLVVLTAGSPLLPPEGSALVDLIVLGVSLLPLLAGTALVLRHARAIGPRNPVALAFLASLFFGLGSGALLLPGGWLTRAWVLPAISLDLAALAVAVGALDAFEQGEAWLPAFLRSGVASLFFALLFGGPLAIWVFFETGPGAGPLTLLLAVLTTAIGTQTFADPLQSLLDRLAIAAVPGEQTSRARLQAERTQFQAQVGALSRQDPRVDPDELDMATFTRLTRRALSHYGDLPRLASSPLTRLDVIEKRLAERNAPGHTLERAAELKLVLTEAIQHLKPQSEEEFGTSEEWRFYNALFYPYVRGLKPYRRRADLDSLPPGDRAAWAWFRSQVPERTLYNWQTAAASLVAQHLREMEG